MPIEIAHDGFIVDGEHRYKVLCDLGVQEIPTFVGTQLGASGRLQRSYAGLRLPIEISPRTHENAVEAGELAHRGYPAAAAEALEVPDTAATQRTPPRRSEYDSGFEM